MTSKEHLQAGAHSSGQINRVNDADAITTTTSNPFPLDVDPVDMVNKIKLLMTQREHNTGEQIARLRAQAAAATTNSTTSSKPFNALKTSMSSSGTYGGDHLPERHHYHYQQQPSSNNDDKTKSVAEAPHRTSAVKTSLFPETSFLGRYLSKYPDTYPESLGLLSSTHETGTETSNIGGAGGGGGGALKIPFMTVLGNQTINRSSNVNHESQHKNNNQQHEEDTIHNNSTQDNVDASTGLSEYGVGTDVRTWIRKMKDIYETSRFSTTDWTAEEVTELEKHIHLELHRLATTGVVSSTSATYNNNNYYPSSGGGGGGDGELLSGGVVSSAFRQTFDGTEGRSIRNMSNSLAGAGGMATFGSGGGGGFNTTHNNHSMIGNPIQHFGPPAAVNAISATDPPAFLSSFIHSNSVSPRNGGGGDQTPHGAFSQSFGGLSPSISPTNAGTLPRFNQIGGPFGGGQIQLGRSSLQTATINNTATAGILSQTFTGTQQQHHQPMKTLDQILGIDPNTSAGALAAKNTIASAEKAIFSKRMEFLTEIVKHLQEMCETVYIGRGTASVAVTLEDLHEGNFSSKDVANRNNITTSNKNGGGGGDMSYHATPEITELASTFDLKLEVLSRAVESWYFSVATSSNIYANGGSNAASPTNALSSPNSDPHGQSHQQQSTSRTGNRALSQSPTLKSPKSQGGGGGKLQLAQDRQETSGSVFTSNPGLFPSPLSVSSAKRSASNHVVQGIAAAAMGDGMMLTSAQVEQVLRAFYAQGARQREAQETFAEEEVTSGTVEGIKVPATTLSSNVTPLPSSSPSATKQHHNLNGDVTFTKGGDNDDGDNTNDGGHHSSSTHIYMSSDSRTKRLQAELAKAHGKEDALRRQMASKTATLKEENAQLRAALVEHQHHGGRTTTTAAVSAANPSSAASATPKDRVPNYHRIALEAIGSGGGNGGGQQQDTYGAKELLLRNPALIESFNTITSVVAETLARRRTRYLHEHVESLKSTVDALKLAHESSKRQALDLSEENVTLRGELKQLNDLWSKLDVVRKNEEEERQRILKEGGTEVERLRAASSGVIHYTVSALTQMLNAVDKREAAYKQYASQWEDTARSALKHLKFVVNTCLEAANNVAMLKVDAGGGRGSVNGSVREKSLGGSPQRGPMVIMNNNSFTNSDYQGGHTSSQYDALGATTNNSSSKSPIRQHVVTIGGGGRGGPPLSTSQHNNNSRHSYSTFSRSVTRNATNSSVKLPEIRPQLSKAKKGGHKPFSMSTTVGNSSVVNPTFSSSATAAAASSSPGTVVSKVLPPLLNGGNLLTSAALGSGLMSSENPWLTPRSGDVSATSSRRSSLRTGVVVGEEGAENADNDDPLSGTTTEGKKRRPSIRATLHDHSKKQAKAYENTMSAKTALAVGPSDLMGMVGNMVMGVVSPSAASARQPFRTHSTTKQSHRGSSISVGHRRGNAEAISPTPSVASLNNAAMPTPVDFALFTPRPLEANPSGEASAPLSPNPFRSSFASNGGGVSSGVSSPTVAGRGTPFVSSSFNDLGQQYSHPHRNSSVGGGGNAPPTQVNKFTKGLLSAKGFLTSKSERLPKFPISRFKSREVESKHLLTNWCDHVQDELGGFLTGGTQVYLDELVDMYGKFNNTTAAENDDDEAVMEGSTFAAGNSSGQFGYTTMGSPLDPAGSSAFSPSFSMGSSKRNMEGTTTMVGSGSGGAPKDPSTLLRLEEQSQQHNHVIQGLTTKLDAAVGEARDKFRECRFMRATIRYFINCVDAVCAGGYSDREHGMINSDEDSDDDEDGNNISIMGSSLTGSAVYNLDRSKKKREEKRRKKMEEHVYPPQIVTDPDTQFRYAWSQECQQLERVFINLRAMLMGMVDKTDSTNAMLSAIREFKKYTSAPSSRSAQNNNNNNSHHTPSPAVSPNSKNNPQLSPFPGGRRSSPHQHQATTPTNNNLTSPSVGGGGSAFTPKMHVGSLEGSGMEATPRRDARSIVAEAVKKRSTLLEANSLAFSSGGDGSQQQQGGGGGVEVSPGVTRHNGVLIATGSNAGFGGVEGGSSSILLSAPQRTPTTTTSGPVGGVRRNPQVMLNVIKQINESASTKAMPKSMQ